ncbi:MAG: serine hydrolase domain-containing protein [Pseudomonadales bacterium]
MTGTIVGRLVICAWLLAAPPSFAKVDIRAWLDAEAPPRMAGADVPALIVAVVHGEETIVAGYGVDAELAVFRVGSVSKPVTASVLLSLAAEGQLRLDEDVRADLTGLPIEPPLDSPLTLHQLLTHTAGFNERLFGQHTASSADFLPLDEYLSRHLPPRFIDPGIVIAYNDHHTALAGRVAEVRARRPFADLARELLFEPLGMHDSSFEQIDLPPHLTARLAAAYPGKGLPPYPRDYIQLPPAAGLYTTAPDMARYLRGLLSGRLPGAAQQLAVQFRQLPELPGRGYGFAEGRHGAQTTFYKDGQASGFNARLLLVPDQGFGLFLAHNRSIFGPFGDVLPAGRLLRELGADLLTALWPEPAAIVPAEEVRADGMAAYEIDLTPYPGTYRTVIAARHTWERLASLFDEAVVRESGGMLQLGSRRYLPLSDELFVNAADTGNHMGFRVVDDKASHVFLGGGAYERVPWWTSMAALPWVLGIPLLGLLISAWRLLRIDTWRVLIGQLPLIAFFPGLGAVLYLVDVQRLFGGPPPVLLVLLALPLLGFTGLTLQAIRLRHSRALARLAGLTAGLALAIWLGYWGLLGYRLG